ncbi:MAG: homocysteine S-methyltransferase family protein [Sedimentisphaerales bacterium]|nr:homocysteine S-methyltransferase family protein [Sedimentisphaerales bacterium]
MGFLGLLASKPVVLLDGAMGTELDKKGLMGRGRTNLDSPDAVAEIHAAYAQAGCDALTTNTLTMNRIYIETHNVGVSVEEVNRAGARLACQATGCSEYVLGDMSSTGQLLEPYGTYNGGQFCHAFREQAQVLANAGINAFLVESMFDLREAIVALHACKEVSSLPVIVSIAFQTETKGGRTMMGDTAEQCAKRLTEEGADVIGANCGDLDPSRMAQVVALLKEATHLPLLAQPNAGLPTLVHGKTVFAMGPTEFADGLAECIRAGAQIVGGCCGTTPQHIRAARAMIEGM